MDQLTISWNFIQALKNMLQATAYVYREGQRGEIPSEEVVPGDIVWIHAGDNIICTIFLIESQCSIKNNCSKNNDCIFYVMHQESYYSCSNKNIHQRALYLIQKNFPMSKWLRLWKLVWSAFCKKYRCLLLRKSFKICLCHDSSKRTKESYTI